MNEHQETIFEKLARRKSILLTLFDDRNREILNVGAQAPSPSKDYCQLIVKYDKIIYRWWKIALHDAEAKYPGEIKDTYEEFVHDELIQRNIQRVFGKSMLTYLKNIVEKHKVDYLSRLPEDILIKIISNLNLEDISRLSQVSSQFRKLCRSDMVWFDLYKKYYTKEISKELANLAERDGWRKLFFTNKIKLQLELRRHANKTTQRDRDRSHEFTSNTRNKYKI